MITSMDLVDAINSRLLQAYPERTVYVDVCPVDFARPSFWIQVMSDQTEDANLLMLRHTVQINLTLTDQLDEHYDASWARLASDISTVTMQFYTPLQVKGRSITLIQKAQPRQPDQQTIQLTAQWMDLRPMSERGGEVPPADSYNLNEAYEP